MRDAARPMASAMAMHICAWGTPWLEIFRLYCLFPAAGVGPFLDAKRRKPLPLPQPHQPALAGLFWGRRELEQVPA